MKSSTVLFFGLSAAALSDASAQRNAPDALNYKVRGSFFNDVGSFIVDSDSIAKSFKGMKLDSVKVNADGSMTFSGVLPNGVLLDNRSESDSYIHNGTRYYIRNTKPQIESKPVAPGSMIYKCK